MQQTGAAPSHHCLWNTTTEFIGGTSLYPLARSGQCASKTKERGNDALCTLLISYPFTILISRVLFGGFSLADKSITAVIIVISIVRQ